MTYHGRVQNGVVVIEDNVRLPEGAQVEIALREAEEATASESTPPTLYEQLRSFAGSAAGLPADASTNIDPDL